MSYDSNNIFARILRQEIPCNKVYEDDFVLAFHDINPKAPIHILVIPKGEYVNFHDFHLNAPASMVDHFYRKSAEIARDNNMTGDGYRIMANCGTNGRQEVPHYHLHLLGGGDIGPMVVPRA